MHKMMVAGLFVMSIGLTSGNATAMPGCDKGMDCLGRGAGEKGMMRHGDDMGGHFRMMIEMLGLNDEQQKAVESIHFAHHKEVIRKTAEIDVAEVELQEIMGKEPVKVEEAEKKIRSIAALQADLDIMHLKAKETIKTKLSPEQLDKMRKHQGAGMPGWMEKCDMGRDDGPMADNKRKSGMKHDMMRDMKHDMMREMMRDEAAAGNVPEGGPADKAEERQPDHTGHH